LNPSGRDRRWKNRTTRGAPIYADIESVNRERLEALRRTLLSTRAAEQAQAREQQQADIERMTATLSPELHQSAMMQLFLQMGQRGALPSSDVLDPATLPPEAAALHEILQARLAATQQRAQAFAERHPIDPDIVSRLREMNPRQDNPEHGASG
jgi:hypothetical protein